MLEFKNVSYSQGSKDILEDINLSINKNNITAIIGPNGSGKSSLIKLLNEKESNYQGEIYYENKRYQRFEYVSDISILLQQVTMPKHISVYDTIAYGLIANHGMFSKLNIEMKQAVEQAIIDCDLCELRDIPLGKLSGGERQRALIAASIVRNPQLLILDEPTTFLDLKYQKELLDLIKRLHLRKMTIVVVLHDINQAVALADDIIALKDGKIIYNDQAQNLTTDILQEAFDTQIIKQRLEIYVTK